MEKYLEIERGLGLMDDASYEMAKTLVGGLEEILTQSSITEGAIWELLDALLALNVNTSSTHTIYTEYVGDLPPWAPKPSGTTDSTPSPTAFGGMVGAGQPLWVCERGPEPFFPAVDGRVLSNLQAKNALRDSVGGDGEGAQTVKNYNFNANYEYKSPIDLMDEVRLREAAGV